MRAPCCVHLGSEGHHLGRSRFIRSLHHSDDAAILLEDRHIFLDAVPDATSADFTKSPPGPWLLAHVPRTQAEHRIAAIGANAVATKALGIATGTPCLLVERRTWRGTETLTIVRPVFRCDAFDLTACFGPNVG